MSAAPQDGYAIVVSKESVAEPAWQAVCEALRKKYPEASTILYPKGDLPSIQAELSKIHPKYACFVTPHESINPEFVAAVHQLTRKLDDDPYTDVLWGILTGYDAANALTIAQTEAPLTIERVGSGTEVALERCKEGIWFCELEKNRKVEKKQGGEAVQSKGPDDTTAALASTLSDYKAQLFVTSGHATERNWQIGFSYRNGYFKCKAGQLMGHPVKGDPFKITAPEPKIYMPIGNCLMGNIDGDEAMALAWMNSAGVRQMLGYTVPTWFGYAGWGCLDYFVEQPGRYTFAEAFFANQHALIHKLESLQPGMAKRPLKDPNDATKARSELKTQESLGMLFDRDALVFYGDPAWSAKMAPGPLAYLQNLTKNDTGNYVLTITPNEGATSFDPVNLNGSQRGGRPFVQFLADRAGTPKILKGAEWNPVITDDFILVPNPGKCDKDTPIIIEFSTTKP